jgi:hypothetical protein
VYQKTKPETEEQKTERLARESEARRKAEELRREQEAAIKRAEELLKEHIGLDAFGELYKVGHIEVDSQKYQGRKYRVFKDAYRTIEVIENGKVMDKL